MYGRAATGRLIRMTTHQAPKSSAEPARPVGRAVTAALALAVPARPGLDGRDDLHGDRLGVVRTARPARSRQALRTSAASAPPPPGR
ncbi:morphogenic membrane protein MmpA [Streptomyces sp. LN245]|uniref:morphogenic membrane protein MmpA n=1 Tax=Streptomyces sp. LN245 TaxID=3112975 RepID=UPI00371E0517